MSEQSAHAKAADQPLRGGLHQPLRRKRLPATRSSTTHKFSVGGHEVYATVGFFECGRPGEVFIKMAKQGSVIRGLMDTIGVLTSVALQHGVPLEVLAVKFENATFEPHGWTKNPDIRHATSLVDYIFRWLRQATASDGMFDDSYGE